MNVSPLLAPLPYHREVRDYLKSQERELWDWFSSARAREDYAEQLRLHLLKSTYRLAPESHAALYASAQAAARALDVAIPVTLYQAQDVGSVANAAIYHLRGEAHIVLSGPVMSLLTGPELTSILGHELAHYVLWTLESEEYLIADRILHAVTAQPHAKSSHHQTARLYRLHTEFYADRGALHAAQHLPTAVSALVKITTGLFEVSGESYLAQAAEVFSKEKSTTSAETHPESFIRAHALELWAKPAEGAEAAVRELTSSARQIDELDLMEQQRITRLTRRFLAQLLRPKWFQTDATLGQAKLYFPDFAPDAFPDDTVLADLHSTGALVKEYWAYVLLDYVAADRELNDLPLAAALRWAEDLEIAPTFERIVTKELGVKAREIAKLKPRIAELLAQAEQAR
jgi:hypothetical protein